MDKEFIIIKKLGQGSFGEVFKVKRISDNIQYALKRVKIDSMKQKQRKNALNEIRLLASIQHPNIIRYKQAFYDQKYQSLCTVMQLAPNGDLYNRLKTKFKKGEYFKQQQIWKIAYQILQGLNALHQGKILHRDLKPANIFFGNQDVVKLGDMNVSKILQQGLAKTQIGTPYYASPQVWNNELYSYQCDVWSFGCILYQICCFRPPFKGEDLDQLYKKIMKCKYEPIPSRYSSNLSTLIGMCLKVKNREIVKNILEFVQKNISVKQVKAVGSCKIIDDIKLPDNWKQFSKILPKPKYVSQKNITVKKIQRRKNIKQFLCQNHLEEKLTLQKIKSQKYLPIREQSTNQKQRHLLRETPSQAQFQHRVLETPRSIKQINQEQSIRRKNLWKKIFL